MILDPLSSLAIKYSLDWSDALQLETVKRGKYSHFCDESQSILITADAGLAEAARKENIRVWNCIKEGKPKWA